MDNTYLVRLRNPAANPDEIEEEYVNADSAKDAELQALEIIANHPFDDVTLISCELVEPGQLYHEASPN